VSRAAGIDKARVQRAFTRGAFSYDAHTPVQERVRKRLAALLPASSTAPRRILDVGAGTGALLAALRARWPAAALCGVDLAHGMASAARRRAAVAVGDAEALPFPAGRFDLVVSTSSLQWLPDLGPPLAEMRRVLAPGGVVALALFGGATLHELAGAWRAALPSGAGDDAHRFHRRTDLEAALVQAGLRAERLESERVVEWHDDPLALVRALRRIGAGNAVAERAARGPATLQRMARIYAEGHGEERGVPATWEILYAIARGP
jgi:malonyl-CoA O-methyltransferase